MRTYLINGVLIVSLCEELNGQLFIHNNFPNTISATLVKGQNYEELMNEYQAEVGKELKKYNRLRDLDIFVLDNSIRESTVGTYYIERFPN